MGGPVLKECEGQISLILYCYSVAIVNRETTFSVAIRTSYSALAPTTLEAKRVNS